MNQQNKVSGVVLAGGLARRMGGQDKGLVEFKRQPLIQYALDAISPVADQVIINANRNIEQYRTFGYPVVEDSSGSYDGPLAGILAAMSQALYPLLLVIPCDSPMMTPAHLQRLLDHVQHHDIAVAFDGERLHPVFLVLKTSLQNSLQDYLQSGERKIDRWLRQHSLTQVDFSDTPEIFLNINTLSELQNLQADADG